MNYHSSDIVLVVLDQLDRSAVWKYRVDAVKLLVHLGVRFAMPSQALGDRVFELLERRLWDEPNKVLFLKPTKATESFHVSFHLDVLRRCATKRQRRWRRSSCFLRRASELKSEWMRSTHVISLAQTMLCFQEAGGAR